VHPASDHHRSRIGQASVPLTSCALEPVLSHLVKGLSVSEAAKQYGITAHAVRYYDEVGLIPGLTRMGNGRRVFESESLAWLEFVVCLRAVGMPIASIRSYVEAVATGRADEAIHHINRHLDELRQRKLQLDHYIALIERKLDEKDRWRAP